MRRNRPVREGELGDREHRRVRFDRAGAGERTLRPARIDLVSWRKSNA